MAKQQEVAKLTVGDSVLTQARKLAQYSDILLALGIIGILMVLLFPIATYLLDFLLAVSITASVVVLMTCLFVQRPLDLSVFPTILLMTAVMRLALNIASTRLILSNGHEGTGAAGHVIQAFGGFVMGNNIVIGVIVFTILTIINFVVITKGSGRIAEVAARFSLDAMPGKQMAIDADLSAGLIDEATAKQRRKDLEDESSFYGSMDGANKFVRGDAIAGILILFIDFIAGIVIGVLQQDLSFRESLRTYSTLTIGDGLVTQIPALIISLSAGLMVSKSGIREATDKAIFGQLGRHPQAIALTAALMGMMAAVPGIPAAPFLLLSAIAGSLAWYSWRGAQLPQGARATAGVGGASASRDAAKGDTTTVGGVPGEGAASREAEESLSESLHIENIRLELGYGLITLINYSKGYRLTDQIKALRKQMARDAGFIMPAVRIQDNVQLPSLTYVIRIKDIECARGEVKPDMLLVMDPKGGDITMEGERTFEPAFQLPAMWVGEHQREEALFKQYTVVDPPTVITTHLTEVVKENITDLLSYSETQKLLDEIPPEHKKLLMDTVPGVISVSGVQRVLQNLLAENVSIRDLPLILEAIAEAARNSSNTTNITEHVRLRLARQISHAYLNAQGYIPLISLSAGWEQTLTESLTGTDEKQLALAPSKMQEFVARVKKLLEEQALAGEFPVLVVPSLLRPFIRSVMERVRPNTVVLAQGEIHPKVKIKTLAQI